MASIKDQTTGAKCSRGGFYRSALYRGKESTVKHLSPERRLFQRRSGLGARGNGAGFEVARANPATTACSAAYESRRRPDRSAETSIFIELSTSSFGSEPAESVRTGEPAMEYRSSAQAPRSMSLQRSLQNGREGLSILYSANVPHWGQRTIFGFMTKGCSKSG